MKILNKKETESVLNSSIVKSEYSFIIQGVSTLKQDESVFIESNEWKRKTHLATFVSNNRHLINFPVTVKQVQNGYLIIRK